MIISVGLFLADLTICGTDLWVLKASIYVLAVMSLFTMMQRIWHVYTQSKILDAERASVA